MAKGQHLSRYQEGIVRRYYDHADTAALQRLAELVSELYVAEDEKAAARMWKSAATALAKTPVEPRIAQQAIAARDIKKLAELVASLSPGGKRAL